MLLLLLLLYDSPQWAPAAASLLHLTPPDGLPAGAGEGGGGGGGVVLAGLTGAPPPLLSLWCACESLKRERGWLMKAILVHR